MKTYSNVLDAIDKLTEKINLALLVFIMCLMFVTVILRYIFNYSLSWSEEVARYGFIWMIFLSSGTGVRKTRDMHVAFDIILNLIPKGANPKVTMTINFFILVFSLIFIPASTKLCLQVRNQVSSALPISMSWIYASAIIGGVLMFLYSLENILTILSGKAPERSGVVA